MSQSLICVQFIGGEYTEAVLIFPMHFGHKIGRLHYVDVAHTIIPYPANLHQYWRLPECFIHKTQNTDTFVSFDLDHMDFIDIMLCSLAT